MKVGRFIDVNPLLLEGASEGGTFMYSKVKLGKSQFSTREYKCALGFAKYATTYPYHPSAWHIIQVTNGYVHNHPFFYSIEALFISVIIDYVMIEHKKSKVKKNISFLIKRLPEVGGIISQADSYYFSRKITEVNDNRFINRSYNTLLSGKPNAFDFETNDVILKSVLDRIKLFTRDEVSTSLVYLNEVSILLDRMHEAKSVIKKKALTEKLKKVVKNVDVSMLTTIEQWYIESAIG